MTLNYFIRDKCVITGTQDLESLYTIKKLPVFIGCTDQPKDKDQLEDMEICISKSSGVIQLKKLLPLDIVYSSYHSEAVGQVWDDHYKIFSKFITKHNKNNSILEMGGSNGRLAELCINNNKNLNWTIVEPNPDTSNISLNKNIKIIKAVIEDQLDLISKGPTFIHSHTLEHLYEPLETLKAISQKNVQGNRMIFSVPNLYKYLKNNFVNTINFEHTYFLTENVLDFLMNKLGYKIVEKYYFQEHSIFYAVEFVDKKDQKINIERIDFYLEYKEMYLSFINFIKNEVKRLNNFISNYKSSCNQNDKIYLFGAHIFSQFLINFGLSADQIDGILDNSQNKQGKRLYGTDLNVMKPEVIAQGKAMVILKAGQYQKEVESQIRSISNKVEIIT